TRERHAPGLLSYTLRPQRVPVTASTCPCTSMSATRQESRSRCPEASSETWVPPVRLPGGPFQTTEENRCVYPCCCCQYCFQASLPRAWNGATWSRRCTSRPTAT